MFGAGLQAIEHLVFHGEVDGLDESPNRRSYLELWYWCGNSSSTSPDTRTSSEGPCSLEHGVAARPTWPHEHDSRWGLDLHGDDSAVSFDEREEVLGVAWFGNQIDLFDERSFTHGVAQVAQC